MTIPIISTIASGIALSKIGGETKILLMKRVKGDFWCHVCGSIEENETAWQTVIREFHEETQIKVSNFYSAEYLDQFYYPDRNVIEMAPVFLVICDSDQNVILNDEHTDCRWCSLDEAIALTPYPNQHRLYEHIWRYFVDKSPNPLSRIHLHDC